MFTVIIILRVLVISFCFLLFVGFLSSFSLPFSSFLFSFSFAVSSSRSLSLPPSPLFSCYFLAIPSSALFYLLSSAFLFLPLLLFLILLFVPVLVSSSLSSGPSFSAFSSLSFSSSFVLSPLLSSSFTSVSFPLPSSSLQAGYSSFSSVLAASLVGSSSSSLPS